MHPKDIIGYNTIHPISSQPKQSLESLVEKWTQAKCVVDSIKKSLEQAELNLKHAEVDLMLATVNNK